MSVRNMGSSETAAPLIDNSDMASDANAGWPAQNPEDMMPSNGHHFDVMPMDFEFGPTAQQFGALPDSSTVEGGSIGYDYSSNNISMNSNGMVHKNHFDSNFEEALSAKTPGYHDFDTGTADYLSSAIHNSPQAHDNHIYQSYGAQTPFQPSTNTYDAKTPYVAPIPYTSPHHSSSGYVGGEVPSLDLNESGAQPSDDFDPGPSPMEETFPTSRPSTPPPESDPTKKTPTPRKAKSKAKAAIAGKEGEDTDEGRSLLSNRSKDKGKAKAVMVDDEEELENINVETPTTGSSNKSKGRKRAAAPKTPKTPTTTPSKKSKTGTAVKKSTKKTTAVDLSTMGHQRVRKVSFSWRLNRRTTTELALRHPKTVLPKSSPSLIPSRNATSPIKP